MRRRRRRLSVIFNSGNLEGEFRALSGVVFRLDMPAEQRHQLLDDRKAKTGAGLVADAFGAAERFKQTQRGIGRQAAARIGHFKSQKIFAARACARRNAQAHEAVIGELDRIAQQIGENLQQAALVRAHALGSSGGNGNFKRHIPVRDKRLGYRLQPRHQRRNIERANAHPQTPGLYRREVQNIVDDGDQMGRRELDVLHDVDAANRELFVRQQLRESKGCVQRRANFMAHARKKR